MATAAPAYSTPSRDDLAREIRTYAPAMYLYLGSPKWKPLEVFGRTLYVPPHLKGEPEVEHPTERLKDKASGENLGPKMVKADGRLAVRDLWGILRDKKANNRPTGVGMLEGQDAGAIVMFVVDNYGDQGVVWLRGDETDAQRQAYSKKLYARSRRVWAEGERAARDEFVKNFLASPVNKGRIPPPPKPTQIEAQEVIDEMAVEGRNAEFICTISYDWEGNSFEKYARHMKAAHGRIVEPPKDEAAKSPKRPAGVGGGAPIEDLEGHSEAGTVLGAGLPMLGADEVVSAGGRKVRVDHESPAKQRKRGR
jgi:hypothetical protein